MSLKRILALATIAGIIGSTAACADVTGPTQQNQKTAGWCPVVGNGGTCEGT
ncbi:MAG TPA: hypothetical protein VF042_10775 [Gemmatimonadaceae bacterium]